MEVTYINAAGERLASRQARPSLPDQGRGVGLHTPTHFHIQSAGTGRRFFISLPRWICATSSWKERWSRETWRTPARNAPGSYASCRLGTKACCSAAATASPARSGRRACSMPNLSPQGHRIEPIHYRPSLGHGTGDAMYDGTRLVIIR